jgi:hypothetical protein
MQSIKILDMFFGTSEHRNYQLLDPKKYRAIEKCLKSSLLKIKAMKVIKILLF